MLVVDIAWNNMPMQVRGHIAKAGEINFFRLHHLAHGTFHGKHRVHQCCAHLNGEVGHFPDVLVPNNAAEAGIVGIRYQYHAAVLAAP